MRRGAWSHAPWFFALEDPTLSSMARSADPGFQEVSAQFIPMTGQDLAPALWTPHRPARPEKSEGGKRFKLVSDYAPAGDQRTAIPELVAGVNAHERDQVLLGVTGSGKTLTLAQSIEAPQRPALIP